MSITYSLALFPSCNATSDKNVKRAIEYSKKLKERSGRRIVIKGRLPKYADKVKTLGNSLKDLGFEVAMYTGIWGGVDLIRNPKYAEWAQKDKNDKPLGYRGSLRHGMLCPNSPFVESILIPEICEIQNHFPFDSIFFDMPWIMKQGCYCMWCKAKDMEGRLNDIKVRRALKFVAEKIYKEYPNLKLAINSGAPGVNFDNPEAHISNLKGIFDEYVTEWNPFIWHQSSTKISEILSKAKAITQGRFSHATKMLVSKTELLSWEKMNNIFYSILSQGAEPWLSMHVSIESLNKINDAYLDALERLSKKNKTKI